MKSKLNTLTKWLDKKRQPRTILTALIILAALFFFPIISANVDYNDDTARNVMFGDAHSFATNGRFVAEWITQFLSGFNSPIMNFGQLGQILGIVAVVAAVWLLLKRRLDYTAKSFLFVAPLIANPFLLENVSYRYDALGMLIAYGLAISAFTFFSCTWKGIALSAGLLFVSFGIYQAMPTVTLGLALVWLAMTVFREKKIRNGILDTLGVTGAYAAGLIGYLIVHLLIPTATNHTQLSASLSAVRGNLGRLRDLLVEYLAGGFITPVLIATIAVALVAAVLVIRQLKSRTIQILIAAAALLLIPFVFLGPLILTPDTIIKPRVVPAFALIGVALAAPLLLVKRTKVVGVLLSMMLGLSLLVTIIFSFTHGAFVATQHEHRGVQMATVHSALELSEIHGLVYVEGSTTDPRQIRKMREQYPALSKYWSSSATWASRVLADIRGNTATDWKAHYPEKTAAICGGGAQPIVDADKFAIFAVPGTDEHLVFLRPSHDVDYCSWASKFQK
ncbi:hypothetical protein KACC15558_11150 [Brevibacterium ammoniilyticum]|uniref:Glucosyl transferase GtrII n=1 Tax=Brevibacterium ammoniilyticum TaxID=1046555 RepID=A0ABP9TXP7_9MICO